jgi:hypothetical protein
LDALPFQGGCQRANHGGNYHPHPNAEAAYPPNLPLTNYDALTVASLRARLRNLGPDELNTLVRYERIHRGREDIIAMFECRLAKLAEEPARP